MRYVEASSRKEGKPFAAKKKLRGLRRRRRRRRTMRKRRRKRRLRRWRRFWKTLIRYASKKRGKKISRNH